MAASNDTVGVGDVSDWVAANWSPELTLRAWWQRLADAKLSFPSWPAPWGRGWSAAEVALCSRALAAAGAIGAPTGLGTLMGGPVVLEHGTSEQQARLLPPLINGTEGWCQLFSEPGAGSDLASLSTRAERDGDEWIVNGQKVWTSGALQCARGMLPARTDPDQPKHRGITYFLIEMDQPGIEIRPIKQMNGRSHFNEVFFNDARVHDRDRVGDVNGGWAVTVATLGYERNGLSAAVGVPGVRPWAGERGRQLDRTVGELIAWSRANAVEPDEAGGEATLLRRLAGERGVDRDPLVRQLLAEQATRASIADATRGRAAAARRRGRAAGPEASLAKLWWTEGLTQSRNVGTAVLGAHGMLVGEDAPANGVVQHFALTIPSARIAGGSDEVQRNIIGERVLGLPKEPSDDSSTPYRDLRRS